jgi:glyoxylase-like metal-dependent hydrolase (beta-lactamase superfamily II)
MNELFDGVLQWSVFSAAKQYDFNGLYLDLGHTRVLVDPPPMSEEAIAEVSRRGAPSKIIVTNKDHLRGAPLARERYGAPIAMHELDAELVDCVVDERFKGGDMVAGVLQVIAVPASKSPGESALYWSDRKILILGDALIGKPPGELSLLPDDKFADPMRARAGLNVFEGLEVEAILVGDGVSITEHAARALAPFLA